MKSCELRRPNCALPVSQPFEIYRKRRYSFARFTEGSVMRFHLRPAQTPQPRGAALFVGSIVILALVMACRARAEMPAYKLSLLPEDESVYAQPEPPREDRGTNQGGVNLDLKI